MTMYMQSRKIYGSYEILVESFWPHLLYSLKTTFKAIPREDDEAERDGSLNYF